MKALLLVLALGVLAAQEPTEFPAGHLCMRAVDVKTPRDHPCACRANDDCSKPSEGQGQGPSENPRCMQYCHKAHCACRTDCQ